MKQKIIIFGDSFGDENHVHNYLHTTRYITLLRKKFDVVTYAKDGSDLWSQFKLMKTVDTSNAKIILFETSPYRITVDEFNYTSLAAVEAKIKRLKILKDYDSIKKYEAARDYFIYLQRNDYDVYVQKKIIEDIKKLFNDIKIIPCFSESITSTDDLSNMVTITVTEHQVWGLNNLFELFPDYEDTRLNHLTAENHKILAEQIENLINGGEIDFTKFVKPDISEFDTYFRKKYYVKK